MPAGDLEDVVDRALKQLPMPRAPQTLLPRVMASIDTSRAGAPHVRTARARPWLVWPLAWQVVSLAVLVAVGLGVVRFWPAISSTAALLAPAPAGGVLAPVDTLVFEVVSTVATIASVTQIVWRALVQPVVGYLFVLMLVMGAACAAFGAALGRVVLGGVPQT